MCRPNTVTGCWSRSLADPKLTQASVDCLEALVCCVGSRNPLTRGRQRQASERMHEAHTRSHKAGRVVGGRVFGYQNKKIYNGVDRDGNPLFSHVERVINPAEAAVVQRIFTLFDSDFGLKRIAKLLNSKGVPEPMHSAPKGGVPLKGWCHSTVGCVLKRELYHGVAVWNATRKRNDWGKWKPSDRPESEWVRVAVPELRIIEEPLWQRVQARRKENEGRTLRFEDGRLIGRPTNTATQNLLAGLAACGVSGGGLVVETGGKKRGRIPEYICHRRRCNRTCTNTVRISVAEMNEAVLQAIEEHALTPEAIEQMIQLTERDDVREHHLALERERKDVEKRITRFTELVETAADVASIVAKLRELEARKSAIHSEIATSSQHRVCRKRSLRTDWPNGADCSASP